MMPRRARVGLRFGIDPYFLIGCVSVLLVGATFFWVRARAEAEPFTPSPISDELLAALSAQSLGHHLGSEAAPVHVVELFDYQCPACAAAHDANWPLLAEQASAGAVRFSVYDVPLPRHTNAVPASLAAACVAREAPDAFWSFRHLLFSTQGAWEASQHPQSWYARLAAEAGAEPDAVRRCVAERGPALADALRGAWRLSSAAGIDYSPAWSVNGKPVRWDEVAREVNASLSRRR